jgi:hypothetical protein
MVRLRVPRTAQRFQVRSIERRLVAQHDQGSGDVVRQRGQSGTQRCAHAQLPIGAVDAPDRKVRDRGKDRIGTGAEDDDRRVRICAECQARRTPRQRLATPREQQLLGLAETARRTGGEHDDAVRKA